MIMIALFLEGWKGISWPHLWGNLNFQAFSSPVWNPEQKYQMCHSSLSLVTRLERMLLPWKLWRVKKEFHDYMVIISYASVFVDALICHHLSQMLLAVWRKRVWSASLSACSAWAMREEDLSMHCLQPAICWASFRSRTAWTGGSRHVGRWKAGHMTSRCEAGCTKLRPARCLIRFHHTN